MGKKNNIDTSKRKFIQRAGYIAPAIITMAAIPSFASAGSIRPGNGNSELPSAGSSSNGRQHRRSERN